MKYRVLSAFYTGETKQVAAGHEFDSDKVGISAERAKELIKRGLIERVDESASDQAQADGATTDNGGSAAATDTGAADYDKMTRADLDKLAQDRGVDIADAKNKGDVADLLRNADAAAAKGKAEPGAPKNKAEPGAPANKADGSK